MDNDLTFREKKILDQFKKRATKEAYSEIQFRREERVRNKKLKKEYIELLQWDGRCACIEKGLIKEHDPSKDIFICEGEEQGPAEAGWMWFRKFKCRKCGNWYKLRP